MSTGISRYFIGVWMVVFTMLFAGNAMATDTVPAASGVVTKADSALKQVDKAIVDGVKKEGDKHGEKGFDVTEEIGQHITDNYRWHIIGHVYFPGILVLYSPAEGLSVFPSTSFEEGKEEGTLVHGAYVYSPEKTSHRLVRADGAQFYDFSITKNVEAMFFSVIILVLVFIAAANGYSKRKGKAPKGIQSAMEPLIIFIRDDVAKSSIGEAKYKKYVPYLLTVFFFIWLNNMMGLVPIIPGGANVTGSLAVTLVLAAISLILILGSTNKHYWAHILNPPGIPAPVKVILVPIEIIGILSKPFALMIRLFANMVGGHIVLVSIVSLIFIFKPMLGTGGAIGVSIGSVAFLVFLYMIKIFVAALQAYIFTLLTALFIGQAVEEPAHHH